MSETELWQRMAEHLSPGGLDYWAETVALPALGSRTVREALADGVECKTVWRAVWEMLELPDRFR